MEIVQIPTSTGVVQDLHVVRQLKGGDVPTEVMSPKQDLSRECAAALVGLPSLERIQSIVKSVSSEKISSLEKAEKLSRKLHSEFQTLVFDRKILQTRLNNREGNLGLEIALFNERVIEYNKIAGEFQKKFESEFLDKADSGFYQQAIIQPEEIRQCPIGDRHLSFSILGHRKELGDPVFVFEAGLASAGTFDGRPIAEAMDKDSCCWVTYDRAGTGRSPARPDVQDGKKLIDHVEEDFHKLLIHLASNNINFPVVLVAHSLGAIYAQNYALKHPDKVAHLILIDPASEDDKDLREASLKASLESQSLLKIPKNFLAVKVDGVFTRENGGGPTPLQPPTEEEVAAAVAAGDAPPHLNNFSEAQRNTDWWMSAHQKQGDTYNCEKENFINTATALKDAISRREKNFKEIPLLVIEKKEEEGIVVSDGGQEDGYSDWRQNTLCKRFGENGTYIRSNETDHNLQFVAADFIAEQIRHWMKGSKKT